MDRSSGRVVDIEILDENGNKKYSFNKYLNMKSFNPSWDISSYGFKRVLIYPWMWEG